MLVFIVLFFVTDKDLGSLHINKDDVFALQFISIFCLVTFLTLLILYLVSQSPGKARLQNDFLHVTGSFSLLSFFLIPMVNMDCWGCL